MDKTCENCIYRLYDDKNGKYYCDIDPKIDINTVAFCTGFEPIHLINECDL